MANTSPWHHLYKTKRWYRLRWHQLQVEPTCRLCRALDVVEAANIVDHVKPHKGDEDLFFDAGNLQSLCKPCHDGAKQRQERTGILPGHDVSGIPVDPMVPFPPIDQGWGYGLHPSDNPAEVSISFEDDLLTVTVTNDGEPYDLKVMITLHILVPDLPRQEELPPPALDPVVAAQTQIAHLRAEADYAIAPLQDAVDIDEGTEAELATLKAWKKYRVALNRVPDQEGYPLAIDWPAAP